MVSTKMITYAKKRVKEIEHFIELFEETKTGDYSTGVSLYEELNRLNKIIKENQ